MKILKISGRNLASLAGEFCVDFEQEPLASAGLFAISGPTGAGKSTLLDALCLALYDATPRLLKVGRGGTFLPDVGADTVSAHDPRTLLRRGAGEGHAEVDFIGNDQLRYRARWSVRRSRGKVAGGLQKSSMTLHRLPELVALGGTKTEVADEIALRVGLSFEQFTRAVLLAQNEFSAFLKTEENERGELLETLTGSVVYSALSRRAFERFRAEQAAMQQLGARLADHTPLDAHQRSALEQQGAQAEAERAVVELRAGALEQQLRWRQQADQLLRQEALAADALVLARQALEAAGERRRRLDTLEAVQSARPLLSELTRLARELGQCERAMVAASTELARTEALQQQCTLALAAAAQQRQAAEQVQREAGPQLDVAKALDASIAALGPSHAKASQALHATAQELTGATDAVNDAHAALAALQFQQQAAAAWLEQHRAWEPRSEQWPRWQALLGQAEKSAALLANVRGELGATHASMTLAAAADADAAAALVQSGAQLGAHEAARQHAIAALAAFDDAQLRSERNALEARREALGAAEKSWSELAALRARRQQAHQRHEAAAVASAAQRAALDAASAAAGALAGALTQAESALVAAELACADSVIELRANLQDGAPCPVCGSEQHPYYHQSAILGNLLAHLRQQVSQRRAEAQDNLALQATQRALRAHSEQQSASAALEQATLETPIANASHAWEAHASSLGAPPHDSLAQWFPAQLADLKAASQALEAGERAARAAALARDSAQQTCDRSLAAHAHSQAQAQAAQLALAAARADHDLLAEQQAHATRRLEELLSELDQAFDDQRWRQMWHADPAAFCSARGAEVAQWRAQSAQHASGVVALLTLQGQYAAASQRAHQASQFHAKALDHFARAEADISAMKTERARLFEARAVSDVEAALAAASASARLCEAAEHSASQIAAQAATRAREALAQARTQHQQQQAQAAAAELELADWLTHYPVRHPALDRVADRAQLELLLAADDASMAAERSALRALEAGLASAATVLAERRGQRELHLQTAAPAPAQQLDLAALAAALEALSIERKQAHDAEGALRLQLAQDDVRRSNAAAMLAAIECQQVVEMRWARLNELIGSADGKKFRNYAQQFTLDVLLGYANRHLALLAKRYRLERVVAASGPSLGLLVRDQDMGGEIRSVNSLSGGESFLVSLALALGLASLSSNRVRVESLFIDEGFGSLDADTLRVAMDALDGLQSMGRKVGVISHVQEMTERIATRIMVQPSGGGTSSVTVQ